jgi:hypothetical protein
MPAWAVGPPAEALGFDGMVVLAMPSMCLLQQGSPLSLAHQVPPFSGTLPAMWRVQGGER